MKATEYLKQYRDLSRDIAANSEELAHLKKQLRRNTACMRYGADDIEARLTDAERRLNAEMRQYLDTQEAIRNAIAALPDGRQRRVLQLRYLEGWNWLKIAVRMEVDRSTVFRWHKAALAQLQPEIPQSERLSG